MPTTTGTSLHTGPALTSVHSSTETTALGGVPITNGQTADVYATMARVVLTALPGDTLTVWARQHVLNEVGYTVGVGVTLWAYNPSLPADQRVWRPIGRWQGDNVDVVRHHLPHTLHDVWVVPADWAVGANNICIVLRCNAHSSAYVAGSGAELDVRDIAVITVHQLHTGGNPAGA